MIKIDEEVKKKPKIGPPPQKIVFEYGKEDIGKYMENLVAINLISRFRPPLSNIFYFKDSQQHEVDFIIKENLKIK